MYAYNSHNDDTYTPIFLKYRKDADCWIVVAKKFRKVKGTAKPEWNLI